VFLLNDQPARNQWTAFMLIALPQANDL